MNTPRADWESFYRLHARPFSLTPDLRFAFASASHTHALREVTEALQRREGVVVVTGEVGTGKTMLCRTLLATFERRTFLSVISDPLVTVEELLTHVLTDFGLITPAEARGPMDEATRHKLVLALQQFLASLIPLNAQAVILIDEAQHLSPEVLEQIRLLANFETDEAKLLQIVLVGQPALDRVLARPDLRQLSQRVARRCHLKPLSEAEVREYVERRLAVATEASLNENGKAAQGSGEREHPVEFSRDALSAVVAISQGVPRVVNTLCDRALQAGFERQLPVIDRRAVLEGAQYLRLHVPVGQRLATKRVWVPAAGIALVAAAVGTWWVYFTPPATPSSAPAVTQNPAPPQPAPSRLPAATTSEARPTTTEVTTPPTPPPATAAPPPVVPPATVRHDDAPASSPPAAVPPPRANPSGAGGFEISVAAFRTSQRAQQVAGELADTKLPVSTRLDSTGNWQLVIVGPFRTPAEAESARVTLVGQGFTDARILPR